MSLRLTANLDRLYDCGIPAEDIRPTPARILAAGLTGKATAALTNFLFGRPVCTELPLITDARAIAVFKRFAAEWEKDKPTATKILNITATLRKNTEILNKEIDFEQNLWVRVGRYALNAISVSAIGMGTGLLLERPTISAEAGLIAIATIGGVLTAQEIKREFLPDRSDTIKAQERAIEANKQALISLWVELEETQVEVIQEATETDLLEAGRLLQEQFADCKATYEHLQRRFPKDLDENIPANLDGNIAIAQTPA